MTYPARLNRSCGSIAGRALTVIASLTISLTNCASPRVESVYDLFIAPEGDFFDSTERIALVPLYFEADLEVHDTIVAMFDSLVQTGLENAGFSVIPSLVYEETWRRIVEDVGGIFDPYTGRRDEERFQLALRRLRQELSEKFDPDVLLAPELWVVEARYRGARVMWDGTSQYLPNVRDRLGTEGTVLAVTFGVVIEDLEGTELYVNGGGIEVFETLDGAIPPEELFADPERIRHAVQTALEPLIHPETPAKR